VAEEATHETFQELIRDGNVLIDFWGPSCAPCLALMPAVEELERKHPVKLVKVNAPQNRQICRDLRVLGLPSYLLFRNGEEFERLIGDPTIREIEDAVTRLTEGG
jgi:thiol-disulfide isomerase/thioredoxin